jgi:hypothetical protein
MRMRMTKKFHRCDDTCKVNHKPKASSPKIIKKIIEKKLVVQPTPSRKLAKKTEVIIDIMEIVEKINNANETNKVLEKTLINLRKLEKDIAN